jgi:hypothetical protein
MSLFEGDIFTEHRKSLALSGDPLQKEFPQEYLDCLPTELCG